MAPRNARMSKAGMITEVPAMAVSTRSWEGHPVGHPVTAAHADRAEPAGHPGCPRPQLGVADALTAEFDQRRPVRPAVDGRAEHGDQVLWQARISPDAVGTHRDAAGVERLCH